MQEKREKTCVSYGHFKQVAEDVKHWISRIYSNNTFLQTENRSSIYLHESNQMNRFCHVFPNHCASIEQILRIWRT